MLNGELMKPLTAVTDLLPKVVNYRLARLGLATTTRPINITLSVTNMCQSRCKTCGIWEMYRGNRGQGNGSIGEELTLSDFEKLFKSLGHVYFVNMSGGEPFLRKDFPDIVEMANELLTPGVIHTPTNAIMPERIESMTRDIMQRLKASGRPVTFTVKPSFDGIGEKHNQIRGVAANFEKLMDTLERLKRLRTQYPDLEIGAGTVISNFNINDIRETARLVHTLGLDSYISEIAEQRSEMFNTSDPITPSADAYTDAIRIFSEESRSHIGSAGQLGKTTGAFRLVYYDLVVRILRENRQVLPCYGGISNVHISPYGDVWPCCVLGYDYSLGRLSDVGYDFWKIWNSPRAAEVRQYIRNGNCACPLANQAYSNMLASPMTMARVATAMISTHLSKPKAK